MFYECSRCQLISFLNKVPEMSRKVFNLFAIDGYSHKEIAAMLNMSEGTTKWHVSTAREKLKSLKLMGQPVISNLITTTLNSEIDKRPLAMKTFISKRRESKKLIQKM